MSRGRRVTSVGVAVAMAATVVLAGGCVAGPHLRSLRSYVISGAGMAPALRPGDKVLAQTEFGKPRRGKIFIVRRKFGVLARRVIGMPGDVVSARDGRVYVNGSPLKEPYLAAGAVTTHLRTVRVSAGHYFVLGDNREVALDSRRYGLLPAEGLIALVTGVVGPTDLP